MKDILRVSPPPPGLASLLSILLLFIQSCNNLYRQTDRQTGEGTPY